MKTENKQLLRELGKQNFNYFEVEELNNKELFKDIEKLLTDDKVLLTINKSCYLLVLEYNSYAMEYKIIFENVYSIPSVNLRDI
jgi:hypothetical protein